MLYPVTGSVVEVGAAQLNWTSYAVDVVPDCPVPEREIVEVPLPCVFVERLSVPV